MIATILRAANSVVHGRCLSVTNVRSAIVRLGALRVAKLAVGVACRALFDVEHKTYRRLFPACFTRLYHSAMTEAFTASFTAEKRGLPASRDLFLATMLHEVGKSLALQSLAATVALGKIRAVPAPESVEKIIAREHGYIGTLALRTWRMPVSIVETCRRQTDDQVPHAPEWTDAHVIRVVSSINDFRMCSTLADGPKWVLRDSSRALGMDRDAVLEVAKWVSEQADQCAALFAVPNRADEPGYEEVVAGIVEG